MNGFLESNVRVVSAFQKQCKKIWKIIGEYKVKFYMINVHNKCKWLKLKNNNWKQN